MNIVVVESPAKARTINKYLGKDYTVLASLGHVRDLPAKEGSVRPDDDFAMRWKIEHKAERLIREISQALKGADCLYLATDPDREGEAISWHVQEVLNERHALEKVEVKRVVFHEVTRDAVLKAMVNPREINKELVEAYLARRALDYLVGFTLSPVLWRKLPGSRSAGRVQSVALRLICEREAEIEVFKPREYWTVDADFLTPSGVKLSTRLTHLNGEKLDKYALADEIAAQAAAEAIKARSFKVTRVERKQVQRNPQPPFTTSTLQQEASRKLRLGGRRTMQIAQRLYEGVDLGGETVGLITYMRTDSVTLSRESIGACRELIGREYGPAYLPKSPRIYKTKTKNAQEAHEAIRPTDIAKRPEDVARWLDRDEHGLYELIWRRTVASGMKSAVLNQVAVDVASPDGNVALRATGSVVVFDGFLRLYQEDRDDPAEDEEYERVLPDVADGDALDRRAVRPGQHFTQPLPRYTEASLVKRLEELGIGRPSTYATILQVLQDRGYVRLERRRLVPEDRGRLVTVFLTSFFNRYVQYNFTAELEDQLDDISGGRVNWKTVLTDFWVAFSRAVDEIRDLGFKEVLETLDAELGPHFFPDEGSDRNPRACPTCENGRLSLKLGKFGAFIGCSNFPECRYTRPLTVDTDADAAERSTETERLIGTDPVSGKAVTVRKGPYGPYLQLDEADGKPKRVSLPKGMDPAGLDLDTALRLLTLPRKVGLHPESGKSITAGIGRFGPYLKHDRTFRSLESVDEVLTIGLNRAVTLLNEQKDQGGSTQLREIGPHPEDGKPVRILKGRYGPYINHGYVNAPLPKSKSIDDITMEEALDLIVARKVKLKSKTGAKWDRRRARKASAAKAKRTDTPVSSSGE